MMNRIKTVLVEVNLLGSTFNDMKLILVGLIMYQAIIKMFSVVNK